MKIGGGIRLPPSRLHGAAGHSGGRQCLDLRSGQLEVDGRRRVADRLGPGRARDRDDDRRQGQHPGERHLLRARRRAPAPPRRTPRAERRARRRLELPPSGLHGRKARPSSSQSRSSTSLDRKPGENWFCTETSRPPRISCASRIWSTDRVGDAGHPDLAGVEQLREHADRVGVVDLRVGPVELVEPDRVHAESLERGVAGLAQVLGRPVDRPGAVTGSQVPALGGHEDVGGVPAVGGQAPRRSATRCGPPRRHAGGRHRPCRSA